MADIPGLIEGAAEGAGLGHDFLRHIDRCRLIVQVVDIAAIEGRDPLDDLKTIDTELAKFNVDLANRPRIIAANKVDSLDRDAEYLPAFEAYCKERGWEIYYISAYTGENTDELVKRIRTLLRELPPLTIYNAEMTPEDTAIAGAGERKTEIKNVNGTYVVTGEWLDNLVGQVNFGDRESLAFFSKVLQKSGVIDMLREAGCKDGDSVSIYEFEFDFVN